MERIDKKLVFHFYLSKDGIDTECNQLHFKCLEHYAANVFDKVVFVIAVDDIEGQTNDILALENKIVSIFKTKELEFKIVDNTYLRDSRTFYDEVASKLEETNELVFFAHNKGTTNLKKFDREKILKWIAAMYFACFYDVKESEDALTNMRALTYGGLLNIIDQRVLKEHESIASQLGQYGYLYTGTFFWLNPRTIYQYMANCGVELPKIRDRWYAENFFANIFPSSLCTSPKDWRAINYLDAHDKILNLINLSLPEMLKPALNEFYGVLGINNVGEKPIFEIIYIATNDYINYLPSFLATLKYFYPGVKKILKVLTNQDIGIEIPCDDVIKCEVIKMFDLFYPCINLHKAKFIEQLSHDEADYIFYFDADTRFIEVPNYDWDSLKRSMDKGYFVMSAHPVYLSKDEAWRNGFLDNLFFNGITDKAENLAASIPVDRYTYVISSFFCAKKDTMLHVCKGINEMILQDMVWQKWYHIPRFSDENYFNKLVYNRENNLDNTYCIRVDFFICIEHLDNEYHPTVFMYQKDGEKFKSAKR